MEKVCFYSVLFWHFRNFSVVGDKKNFLKNLSQNFGKIALCGVVGSESPGVASVIALEQNAVVSELLSCPAAVESREKAGCMTVCLFFRSLTKINRVL